LRDVSILYTFAASLLSNGLSDIEETSLLLFVLAVKPNFLTLIPNAYLQEQFITLKFEFVKNISF